MNLDDYEEPPAPKLDMLMFPTGDRQTMYVEFDYDEVRFRLANGSENLALEMTAALELDALAELYEKIIGPALAYRDTIEKEKADAAERVRLGYEARAEERAREQAELERSQTFRGVSVQRTITQNMTVHGRVCASLAFAQKNQTLGTVIFHLTPDNLIAKLLIAMTGRLNLRFCVKCKPIPNAARHNAHMNGGLPLDETEGALAERLADDIWEAHHAALKSYDERTKD